MIAIVDYGLGNPGSVANMLKRLGTPSIITADPAELRAATGLIIPGVGHFDTGMKNLRARGLVEVLSGQVLEQKTPVLGICLGMQLLARCSEEGSEPGLGWIAASVQRFQLSAERKLPIPHMGWNEVEIVDRTLFEGLEAQPRFYFVHSYHLVADQQADVAAWATYGYRFAAAVHRGHIFGTQFHPEKSHRFGITVLRHFVESARAA